MTLRVALSEPDRTALVTMVRRDPKAYKRERAAALLQIADGHSAAEVAQSGLLLRREPETVAGWVHRFHASGLASLTIAPGRGRKPAFSP